jgi:hypothetical protein
MVTPRVRLSVSWTAVREYYTPQHNPSLRQVALNIGIKYSNWNRQLSALEPNDGTENSMSMSNGQSADAQLNTSLSISITSQAPESLTSRHHGLRYVLEASPSATVDCHIIPYSQDIITQMQCLTHCRSRALIPEDYQIKPACVIEAAEKCFPSKPGESSWSTALDLSPPRPRTQLHRLLFEVLCSTTPLWIFWPSVWSENLVSRPVRWVSQTRRGPSRPM